MNKMKTIGLACVLALLLAVTPRVVTAQAVEPAPAGQASEQKADAAGESKPEAVEAKGAEKEEKKEAAEDASKKFLESPVVAWLGKLVGLDAEKMSFTAVLINFAILAALLFFGLRKALPAMFRDRTATIQKAMEDARKASEDANRRLADVESRLANLGKEIAAMGEQAEQAIATEEQRLQSLAAEEMNKIVASAEQEIAAFGQAARRELTAHAADLAVTLARQRIQVDGATDQALVRNFADGLSQPSLGKDGQ